MILGSKAPFLKKRDAGTERADKAAPEARRRQVLRRHADLGDPRRPDAGRRRRPPRDRRQLRAEPGRDDPVRAAVPDAPLAPELLPAQRAACARPPDADGRYGAAAQARAPGSSSASPTGPTTSSGRRPRRSCSTRSSGSSDPAMQRFAYERPERLSDAIELLAEHGAAARPLAGGTDLIIRLRDGTISAGVVVDVKRVAGAGAGDPARGRPAGRSARGP